jgi:hypothetical protein
MRFKLRLVLIMLAMGLVCSISAANDQEVTKEPLSFRGLLWRTPLDEAMKRESLFGKCGTVQQFTACDDYGFAIGDVPVHNRFFFTHDGFAGAVMRFDSKGYEFVRDVFVKKYGTPTSISHETVKNLTGAEFTNETNAWSFSGTAVYLSRYGDSLVDSVAFVGLVSWVDDMNKAGEQQKVKAAKSF